MQERIKSVRVVSESVLDVQFDDRHCEIDFKAPIISTPVFLSPLAKSEEFSRVQISENLSDLVWPCGLHLGVPVLSRWARATKRHKAARVRQAERSRWLKDKTAPRPPQQSAECWQKFREQIITTTRTEIRGSVTQFKDADEARRVLLTGIAAEQEAECGSDACTGEYVDHFLRPEAFRRLDNATTEQAKREAGLLFLECAKRYDDVFSAGEYARLVLSGICGGDSLAARQWFEVAMLSFSDEENELFAYVYLAEFYLRGKGGLVKSHDRGFALYRDLEYSPMNGRNLIIASARLPALSSDYEWMNAEYRDDRSDKDGLKVVATVNRIVAEVRALKK